MNRLAHRIAREIWYPLITRVVVCLSPWRHYNLCHAYSMLISPRHEPKLIIQYRKVETHWWVSYEEIPLGDRGTYNGEAAERVLCAKRDGYVRVDEYGTMRIGNSRVMRDSIVAGFEQGHSPETLQQQYPTLSLVAVYGAITSYLAHTDEVHAYLKRQDELWDAWRAQSASQSSPVVERLRAQRASEAAKRS